MVFQGPGGEGFTSYSVDADKRFEKALDEARKEVSDLRIPLRLISFDFYKSERAIFKLKGPGQYPDLSTKPFFAWWEKTPQLRRQYDGGYKEYKTAKVGFAYPILYRTGKLAASVLGPNAEGSINKITKTELIIGTDIPYAPFHQSDRPRSKIPLRKFLFIGPEAQESIPPNDPDPSIRGRLDRWMRILEEFVFAKSGALIGRKKGD